MQRFKKNTIHLQGIIVPKSNNSKDSNVNWTTIEIGDNVQLKRKSSCDVKSSTFNEVQLQRTKNRFIMVTASKKECETYFPSLIVSQSVNNTWPSGHVVLLTTVFNDITQNENTWTEDDYRIIKKSKPNILAKNTHHESNGFYASYGNKGSFNKSINSSIGQYANKWTSSKEKKVHLDYFADVYEERIADEIGRAIQDLYRVLPKIKLIISPIVATAYELQASKKNINIKEGYASKSGCWQTSICVNATTGKFHCENNCTYTLISVPKQNTTTTERKIHNYHFLFSLSDKKKLNIPLFHGISFVFSAAFLSHRQHRNQFNNSKDESFFNVASYGNKRLFNHIKKSFNK